MFINGTKVNDTNNTLSSNAWDKLILGNNKDKVEPLNATLDELRISNNLVEFLENIEYSYINYYPSIWFTINQTTGYASMQSHQNFRGRQIIKFIATDSTNRSVVSGLAKYWSYLSANYTEYSGNTTDFNYADNIKSVVNPIVENSINSRGAR